MNTMIILQQMAVITILVLIGVFLYRRGIVDNQSSKKMSAIVVDVCNPALAISCVLAGDIKASREQLLAAVGVVAAIYGILCILGLLIPRLLRIRKGERKFYNMMTVYANTGFIGIPVAKAVLSDTAMLYVIIFNVMFALVFYTHGVFVLGGGKQKFRVRNFLNPGTTLPLLALLIYWFGIELPAIISETIIYVGNATVFLSMTLLGVSLAKAPLRESLKERKLYPYVFLRMLVLPLALACILRLINLPEEMIQAFTLMSAMPVANLPMIQAEKIGEDTVVLSRGIVMTTVLSLVTVTAVTGLLFH